MRIRKAFCLLTMLALFKLAAQDGLKTQPQLVFLQGSLSVNSYNSLDVKYLIEYQKAFKEGLFYGLAIENSRNVGIAVTGFQNEIETDATYLSANIYKKLQLLGDKVFWNIGIGVGIIHVFWEDNDRFGPLIRSANSLNIRLGENAILTAAPLLFFPPFGNGYFSPIKAPGHDIFYAYDILPIGIKIKI